MKFDNLTLVLLHEITDISYLYKEAVLGRSYHILPNHREITLEPTSNYGDIRYKRGARSTDTLLHRLLKIIQIFLQRVQPLRAEESIQYPP